MIKAAEDSALQYMNFMNVIFAAQKQVKWIKMSSLCVVGLVRTFLFKIQNILIDACVLDLDSGLLQQVEVGLPLSFLQVESFKTPN